MFPNTGKSSSGLNTKSCCCNGTFTNQPSRSTQPGHLKNTNYLYAVRISISLAITSEIFIQIGYLLTRVSIDARDIDSNYDRLSVRHIPVFYGNGLKYCQFLHRTVAQSF